MYLNQTKTHLASLMQEKIPVFLWGPPGIGKSTIIKQLCEEWGWQLVDLRLSLLNPIDLRGLPMLDKAKNEAVWLRPEFLPIVGVNGWKEKGILFLDELNTAPVSVQIAAYQLLLDRRIGNYIFPDGWRLIAAGNRETDQAAVTRIPSPLANRLIHIDTEANINDWKIWATGKIDERVIGFLNFRPKLLSTLPKEEEKAFPTPRSWEFVSRVIKLYKDIMQAEDIIRGTVGDGATKEFISFVNIYSNLPDIDAILEGKSKEIPQKNDVLYALCTALVAKLKPEHINNFLEYSMLLPTEFATLMLKDAFKNKKLEEIITKNPLFEKWTDKYVEYL